MPYLVAMTKPNHEAIAAANLKRQGFTFYYPKFLLKKGIKEAVRPLFPRYIFVLLEQQWRSLTGTRGISYVLMGEGGPQLLCDEIVELMRAREDTNGLFQFHTPPKFKRGEKVKTQEGPLTGLPMIYEDMAGADRVKVLCDLMGRTVIVTVEEKSLVAA